MYTVTDSHMPEQQATRAMHDYSSIEHKLVSE